MKQPSQKDEIFLADVNRVLSERSTALWWLGQSGFLILHAGRAIVLDPYLSDSLTTKYQATDKPHVRLTERVVAPEALAGIGVIDLIASSHNHTDHLDAETLRPLLDRNFQARMVIPAANLDFVLDRLLTQPASRMLELDAGASAKLAGLEIFGIPAAHPTIEKDPQGRCRFLGYVVRWDNFVIYHSGDTLWHDEILASLRPFKIDLAVLPINGDRPERRVAGNLNGRQAAQFAKAIDARCVVPCHFDLFEFNTASPDEFAAECGQLSQPFRVLQNGERLDLPVG